MEAIGWQEILIRLLFTLVLGSATTIEKKWYLTKRFLQTNTLMALGTAMFAIMLSSLGNTDNSSQLIFGVSGICLGVGWQKQTDSETIERRQSLTRLWCAGAIGSLVGFGLFVPAYISVLAIILTNLIFADSALDGADVVHRGIERQEAQSISALIEGKFPVTRAYRCLIRCLAKNEAEVLSTIVQLGQKNNLTLTGISSKNLSRDRETSEVEMTVDFVSDFHSSLVELQSILAQLKSRSSVNAASWKNLSSEILSKNDLASYKM